MASLGKQGKKNGVGVVTANDQLVYIVKHFISENVQRSSFEKSSLGEEDLSKVIDVLCQLGCRSLILDCKTVKEISQTGWSRIDLAARKGVKVLVINADEAICGRGASSEFKERRRRAPKVMGKGVIAEELISTFNAH